MSDRSLPPSGAPFYAAGLGRNPEPDEDREVRECRSCYGGGWVLEDAEYDPTTGELVQTSAPCPICGGAGSVSVFRYRAPKRR